MTTGVDLIFISMEDWDHVWRRNQFVCAELARRHANRKILFVGLPLDLSNRLRRGDFSGLSQSRTHSPEDLPNITFTKPLKLLPNTLTPTRKLNEAMVRRHVLSQAKSLGLRNPVLWLNPHYAVHMVGRMGESAVVYDITDDWSAMEQSARLRDTIIRQDTELCRRADAVIVCSQRLYDLKSTIVGRDRLHLIPNGVDTRHYQSVLDATGPLPAEAASWPSPVFGYTGTIHPDRVDVGLVENIAQEFPHGSVVMVGPDFLPQFDRDRLAMHRNIHLTGPRPYQELPALMRAFDVCIVPHRMTPFTESLNPIKLWEYLAAGQPIVSTDVAGFRDYPDFVRIGANPRAFLTACHAALQEDPSVGQQRRRSAEGHSWSERVDVIENVIHDCLSRRAGGVVSDRHQPDHRPALHVSPTVNSRA